MVAWIRQFNHRKRQNFIRCTLFVLARWRRLRVSQQAFKVTAQVSLGALILASQNRPNTQIGAIAVRMIENAITVEFMEVSEITDHELT